ncbi:calmodulin-interacting protein [Canna indica]|uniref:Calmodulin-interacting protein n=1 Tax=Canna indica TaxID=4628 RepID=A0AAQ3QK41_9LILI|nr:calmodulin-interacting protein [Canna indica]
MPSKGKKSSRASPAAAVSDRSPLFARTPTAHAEGAPMDEDEVTIHPRILADAAAKFPALISEAHTFCGRVSETESSPSGSNHARVWLSSAAMNSNSIAPGSIVSVSLPASGKAYTHNCPLSNLAEECTSHFCFDAEDNVANRAGSYFAIASVFPSVKVLKDAVRLSWPLSCTMGSHVLGRAVFICPIEKTSAPLTLNNSDGFAPSYLYKCKDIYLKAMLPGSGLISYRKEIMLSDFASSSVGVTTKNEEVAPPETSSHQNKLSSLADSPINSRKPNRTVSTSDSPSGMDVCVKLALDDEKTKELVQIFAARWLNGRHLLSGNFVCIPICGQFCFLLVEGSDILWNGCSSKELPFEKNCLLPHEIHISSSLDKLDVVLVVDSMSKVHLYDSTLLKHESSNKVGIVDDHASSEVVSNNKAGVAPKLGGLHKEFAMLNEIISSSLYKKVFWLRYKGVLLHGPPGTGKTSLATSCAYASGASLFCIIGPEIIREYYGESEQALREVFDSAKQAAPSIVFIDEFDAIAPARKEGSEDLSRRMVGTLLQLMDEINKSDPVLVIAATNCPNDIDPAFRRPGRLDREIEIGVPSPTQRSDILCTILNEMDHSLSSMEIQSLASDTHGFVGADLAALCNEAGKNAFRRCIKVIEGNNFSKEFSGNNELGHTCHKDKDVETIDGINLLASSLSALNMSADQVAPHNSTRPQENGVSHNGSYESLEAEKRMLGKVTFEDFEKAKTKMRPSSMREVMLEVPKVRWEDVGGYSMIKEQLIEAVKMSQTDLFKHMGFRAPRGLLMIGPPGCSKTLMARAVASEAKLNFFAVKGPELLSQWVGETEKAVRDMFRKAKANSPAIVFFDEIDGLAGTRGQDNDGTSVGDRVVTQLLVEMDGLDQKTGVTVIAATNCPDKIDPALLRPGRFDRILDVQPPAETERADIFRVHLRNTPCSADVSIKDLAQLTEGYTGADIMQVCRKAAMAALEESTEIAEVSMVHFKVGISRVQPADLKYYSELAVRFRRLVDNRPAKGE